MTFSVSQRLCLCAQASYPFGSTRMPCRASSLLASAQSKRGKACRARAKGR